MPIFGECPHHGPAPKGWQIIDSAERESMADIAGRTFFSCQITVVLRDGGLEHGCTKVWRVRETLGEGVVSQEGESMCITAPHVHIAGVIPALRCIFQQVDGADGENRAYRIHARRQDGAGHKTDFREWPARADRTRSRRRVVDEMCALQVDTMVPKISDLQSCFSSKAFFNRRTPLFEILRRRVG